MAEQIGSAQHLLETGLVQAHLLGAGEFRHLVVLDELERAGHQPVVDRVEDDEMVRFGDELDEIEALRAAVENGDIVRHRIGAVESLDGAHAETFVRPEDVADAEYQDARRGGGVMLRHQSASSSLNSRSPEIIEEMIDWRLMMSSRTAT